MKKMKMKMKKMRWKSFPIRSWRKSLDPYQSPNRIENSEDERFGSGASSTHCDPQCDSDVEIVPVTFDERDVPLKKRHYLVTGSGDACLVCEISDKWVSRCPGIDCLLSFHDECLNAAELGSCEEKALGGEKAVLSGDESVPESQEDATTLSGDENGYSVDRTEIVSGREDTTTSSGDDRTDIVSGQEDTTTLSGDENGYSVCRTDIVSDQELQGDKDDSCSSKGEVDKDSDQSNMPLLEETDPEEYYTGNLQVIDEVEALEDQERVATENFQTAQDQTKVNTDGSGKENDQVQQNEKRRRRRRRRRRRIALKAIDNEISFNESTNEPTGEDVTEQITEVATSKTARDISFFNKDHKRRILWTPQEEEMLKVGVEKFAAEANMNMPWRKILEMGKNVFHEIRTPASLKDKWRNMIRARLGQKTNKTPH